MSKQECMVQLAEMDLWTCSESFQRISLSGYTKLGKEGTSGMNKYLKEYAFRPWDQRRLSLMSWFLSTHSEKNDRTYVPYFPGRSGQPVFPLTEYMSRMLF